MRMLLNTNVLLDVALERSPFFADSDRTLALVERKQIVGFICASSISDIFYILRKSKGRQLAIDFLEVITSICLVATVNDFIKQTELNTRKTAQPKLALKRLKSIIIPVPPIAEQRRIVEILDEAFKAIALAEANTKKNLANAIELFDSYLNQVFLKNHDYPKNYRRT